MMQAIEKKLPGTFVTRDGKSKITLDDEGADPKTWGTETRFLDDSVYGYLLGAQGKTRRKLGKASGCMLEYVGQMAFMCGSKADRSRVQDYMGWLLQQRSDIRQSSDERTEAIETAGRDDVTALEARLFRFFSIRRPHTLHRFSHSHNSLLLYRCLPTIWDSSLAGRVKPCGTLKCPPARSA